MSSFIETPRFPDEIAFWMGGGAGWKTTVVETYGGDEYRNAAWSQPRADYSIRVEALRSVNANVGTYYKPLRNLFMVARGQLYGFRLKDFRDFSDDAGGIFVMLTSTTFQMYKSYSVSPLSLNRIIQKPVSPIVVTGGSVASINYTTGIVTMTSGTPTSWTGTFDVPVRFASDLQDIGPDNTGAMFDWQSLKLIEIRNPG